MRFWCVFLSLFALFVVAVPAHGDYPVQYEKKVIIVESHPYPSPFYPVAFFQFLAPPTALVPVNVSPTLIPQQSPQQAPQGQSSVEQRLDRIERLLSGQKSVRDDGPPMAKLSGQSPPEQPDLAQVASILQRRCAECHTHPGRGEIDIFTEDGVLEPVVSREDIYKEVLGDRMPRGRPKLPVEEKDVLRVWAKKLVKKRGDL